MNESYEELYDCIREAMNELYTRDNYLINNKVREEALVSKYQLYLQRVLEARRFDFKLYSLDNEYNLDCLSESGYKEIIYKKTKKRIIPDLLIHERGSNAHNLLAFEFKNVNNYNKEQRDSDYRKLKALTCLDGHYKYKYGLFIKFSKQENQVKYVWFKDGKEIK